MIIDKYERNLNYFESFLSKIDKHIYANDFDNQFNNIACYLNEVIKPAIDGITNQVLKGIAGNIGAYLKNIGDGSTVWQQLDNNSIADYSIPFDRLASGKFRTILVTNNVGRLTQTTLAKEGRVLMSRKNNTPVWRKITSKNINYKTLTGKQLSVLDIESFVSDLFVTNIKPNIINTSHIKDLNITNKKLQDASITHEKLGVFHDLPVVTNGLNISHFAQGAITTNKIKNGSISVRINETQENDLWGEEYGITKGTNGTTYKQLLKSEHILDNSIDESQLTKLLDTKGSKAHSFKACKGFFKQVPLEFQFQSNHIAKNCINRNHLDLEIRKAIDRLK